MNKKVWIAVVALVAVAALMLGVFFLTRGETAEGVKRITVTVVHKDGSEKVFRCRTEEEYLGPVLLEEKIVEGEMGQFGLYIHYADGERAVYEQDKAWWGLYQNGESCVTGADQVVIRDGDAFRIVYSVE